jgi:hypothetical protein
VEQDISRDLTETLLVVLPHVVAQNLRGAVGLK